MKIEVCIPAYNNENTILETLQSIKEQKFDDFSIPPNVEISILDDFSTDNTIKKIGEFQVNNKELKTTLYRGNKNEGLASSLNYLVSQCSEEDIIVFLAGDDYLLQDALDKIFLAFNRNSQLGIAVRYYYWFKDDWRKPVRWTKRKNFKIEDLIFLCGQLSGISLRKSMFHGTFQPLVFCEFASGILSMIKEHDSIILEKPTVAVRINSSESCSSWVYNQSSTLNWHKIIKENFSDNKDLMKHLEKYLARNYIGLLQIRMHGGWKKAMVEVLHMLNLDSMIFYHYKFWFYLLLIQLPSKILKKLRNMFIYGINRRLCK